MTQATDEIERAIDDAFLFDQMGIAHTNLHLYPSSPSEGLSGWNQPGNVGNTGGASPKPHGTSTWTPGAIVTARPVIPYDNFYFVKDLPVPAVAPTRFVSIRQHSIANLAGWQALEFEHELHWSSFVYNMAWQFDQANKRVGYFNYNISDWEYTKIPMPVLSNLVTVAEFAIDTAARTCTHVALTICGAQYTRYPVNITQPATPKQTPNKLTIAEQMDPNGVPVPISMTIGQCDLRII